MSTYYSPGCENEKAHVCDFCEENDGRPTFYWIKKDFDLCPLCIKALFENNFEGYGPKNLEQPKLIIKRISISEKLRNRIFKRDKHKCTLCSNKEKLCIDHKIPFVKGGRTEYKNLQTLCKSCNSKKGAK